MSGQRRRRDGRRGASRRIPLTTDALSLLVDGSDARLRQLVYDLFIVSVRMQQVRAALARRMNVTGPQYSVLMAVGELQGNSGVTVGTVAQRMHVTGAHATIEVGKLVKRGLLSKATNPKDGRSVLLRLTPRGFELIDKVAPLLRETNDRFFGKLDRKQFLAASVIAERLVTGSEMALRGWQSLANGDRAEESPHHSLARNGHGRHGASGAARVRNPLRRAAGNPSGGPGHRAR